MVKRLTMALAAAVIAGVAMGAAARLLMRFVSLAAGHSSEFSLAGTVGIIVAFVVVTVPGTLLAALWGGRGRSALLVVGSLFLSVVATGIAMEDLQDLGSLSPARWAGLVVSSAGIYATVLALPVLALRLLGVASVSRRPAGAAPQ
jgi:hypothetical protein